MAFIYSSRPSTPMHWDINQSRGTPSMHFVGGFQLPQMGVPEQQTVAIITPPIPAFARMPQYDYPRQYVPEYQCEHQYYHQDQYDYQRQYFPMTGYSYEERQYSVMSQATLSYTPVHETSHRGLERGKDQNKLRKTLQLQYTVPQPYELAPPIRSQAPRQPSRYPSFYTPGRSPRPEQVLTNGGPRAPNYSSRSGRRKAVCIGINYTGSKKPLKGCVKDAENVCKFLIKWKFKPEDILVLRDDGRGLCPTKVNILGAIEWLVKDAKAGDSLFFFYAGHGVQELDIDGDEVDGYDEAIVPFDSEWGVGPITDDTLNELLVRPIPRGCRLTALFDTCHSGSVLDLVYLYNRKGRLKSSDVVKKHHKNKSSKGLVVCFSGCKDGQKSKEGSAGGAMSNAFVKCLGMNPNQTYHELLKGIRHSLQNEKCKQKPQLSSSYILNTKKRFTLYP